MECDTIDPSAIKELIFKYISLYYSQNKHTGPIVGKEIIPYSGAVFDDREINAMVQVLLDGWFGLGKLGHQFEKEFSSLIGVKHTILINSGSSANLLAISSLFYNQENPINAGDEVITPACTFPTTVNPIIQNNLVPIFIDVDSGTYNILIPQLKKAITPKTKLLMIPHTLGNPNNMEELLEIANEDDIYIIEDACDALGSYYKNKMCGSFGALATFSFYPAHHITLGEGGAVVTNNDELYKILRSLRDWGRACWCGLDEKKPMGACNRRFSWKSGSLPEGYDHKYTYSTIGYNLKPLEMQAAMGLVQLKRLHDFTMKRSENFEIFRNFFQSFEKYFILPQTLKYGKPNWFAFPLTIKEEAPFTRVDLLKYLFDKKIDSRPLFTGNILKHPAYFNINCKVHGGLQNSDRILKNSFFIGIYPGLSNEHINYIKNTLRQFFNKFS